MAALEVARSLPDENRMVGHYWLRDPDLANPELKRDIVQTLEQIEAFTQKFILVRFILPKHPLPTFFPLALVVQPSVLSSLLKL